MRRLLFATLGFVLAAVVGAGAASGATYEDPAGDNGSSPDITRVTVGVEDGRIAIQADIANLPELFSAGTVVFGFDTDRNPTTGSITGADYVYFLDWATLGGGLARWNGSDYESVAAVGPIGHVVGAATAGVRISPASLGGSQSFGLFVLAAAGPLESASLDRAPDSGVWDYAGEPEAAPAPEPEVAPELDTIDVGFAPAKPRAGKRFRVKRVSARLTTDEVVAPDTYRCKATLGRKRLRGTGPGGCSWKLPADAKGKRLVVTVTAMYGGTKATFEPYRFKVR